MLAIGHGQIMNLDLVTQALITFGYPLKVVKNQEDDAQAELDLQYLHGQKQLSSAGEF
jgi:hypothetical protein